MTSLVTATAFAAPEDALAHFRRRLSFETDCSDVHEAMQGEADFVLVDVRGPALFARGHVPGAVNIPVDDLRARLEELPRDREIAVYCQVGQRGYLATRILRQRGYAASNIGGGYKTYLLFRGPQAL